MLYHLFYEQLFQYFSPFRVFGYITFRTAFASMTALGLGLILGPWLIGKLRDFQIGQFIREDGPESHHDKAGTPTMGGLLITVSIVLPTLLWANLTNVYVWIALFGLVGFGGIGFLDDYTKIRRGQNLGLTVTQKILLQVLVTLAIGSSLIWLFSAWRLRCPSGAAVRQESPPQSGDRTAARQSLHFPVRLCPVFRFSLPGAGGLLECRKPDRRS